MAQVAPVPLYPALLPLHSPLPMQTAISLPQRALWLVIWRLISGLTWQRLLPVLMLFNIVLQLLSLPPFPSASPPPLPTSERINKNYCIYLLFCMSLCCCFSYSSSFSSYSFSACHWVLLSFYPYPPLPPTTLLPLCIAYTMLMPQTCIHKPRHILTFGSQTRTFDYARQKPTRVDANELLSTWACDQQTLMAHFI